MIILLMKQMFEFFCRYLAIFKDCLESFSFEHFFGMMRNSSLSSVRISPPNFMTAFALAVDVKSELSYYMNYFSICNSWKMFSHSSKLCHNRYRYLKAEGTFTFKSDCREKFPVISSALDMDMNYVLDIANNFSIGFTFSVTSLKSWAFSKISAFFTCFNYYRKKVHFFHDFYLHNNFNISRDKSQVYLRYYTSQIYTRLWQECGDRNSGVMMVSL